MLRRDVGFLEDHFVAEFVGSCQRPNNLSRELDFLSGIRMARSFEAIDALVRLAQDPVRNKHIAASLIEWILLWFLYALGDLAMLIVRNVERHSRRVSRFSA